MEENTIPLITYTVKNYNNKNFEIIETKTIKISYKDKNVIEINNYHDILSGKSFQYRIYNNGKVIESELPCVEKYTKCKK
jgi:hypothetical protein